MYPIGCAMCPQNNTYLQGIYIDDLSDNNGNNRIEEGKCSAADMAYTHQAATCADANWAAALD